MQRNGETTIPTNNRFRASIKAEIKELAIWYGLDKTKVVEKAVHALYAKGQPAFKREIQGEIQVLTDRNTTIYKPRRNVVETYPRFRLD
ncbi:MAG: hypothetical protein EPO20_30615 [Betaproteobacteria bacterium]|nr:MAG: hypothetical protein EPO20_30615 [Betaproteobacteria bacterium]